MFILTVSTCISILNVFLPIVLKNLLSCLCLVSARERQLQNEEMQIKSELSTVPMIDEFAKHARLQRKLISVQQKLKTAADARLRSHAKAKFIVSCAVQFILSIVLFCFIWIYKYTPVATFPSHWLKPFNAILSWPTGVDGGISLLIWLLCVGTVARQAAKQISS